MGTTPRLAVLISGGGRTLVNLWEHTRRGDLRAEIVLAIASKETAGAMGAARARELGLTVEVMPGRIPKERLAEVLAKHRVDWVVLAGYLHLLDIPAAYRGKVVNIHPALLPEFGGAGMYGHRVHEAVLAAKQNVSGCTVHFADEAYDTGRVILQRTCPVLATDTPETLAARVFELELEAYPAALKKVIEGGR